MAPRERLLIWGGGGHGKVVADVARAAGFIVAGFLDSDEAKRGAVVEPGGARVLVAEAEFLDPLAERGELPAGVDAVALGVGDNPGRVRCLARLGRAPLPVIVHPSAVVSRHVEIGRGSVVFPLAVVNSAARLGAAVIVNSGAIVEHDCELADGVHLSPGAVLSGGARVGERGWIGAGAVVLPGVLVGADSRVGAGAVVNRDVTPGSTVVGVPARAIHSMRTE